MTQHNITGWEPTGPHVVIRHTPPRRRPLPDRILSGIGAATVLVSALLLLAAVLP